MNIVKLQNELKGVPDEALIGYVKNPNGQVPTYLALSELQRRKEMRNSYEAQKGPEKSVAQGLVDEAQPQPMQQGIAAMAPQQMEAPQPAPMPMPQDPMAPPQGMAHGGTVRYAEGGETESRYLDSQAPLNLNARPSLNLNYGSSGMPEGVQNLISGLSMAGEMDTINPGARVFSRMMSGALRGDPEMLDMIRGKGVPASLAEGLAHGGEVHYADGGIAGLDTGNMYDEQIYAQGGIVAFADGGEAESNYLDSQAALNLDERPSLNVNTGEQGFGGKSYYITPDGSGVYAGRLFKDMYKQDPNINPLFKLFSRLPDDTVFTRQMAEGGEVKGYAGPDGSDVQADTPTSRIDAMYKLLSGAPNKFYRSLAESTANIPYEAARSQFPGLPENIFHKNVLGGEPGAGLFGTSTPREYPSGDKIPGANIAPTADTITGAKPAAESTKPAVADDPFAALKKTLAAGPTEKPKSMQDYAAEYKQALGEDPTVQGAKDRLAKMEARAADREEKSGWMALAKAGLTMAAGKSPRAIQNIAEGATAGVNDYVSAQEKLDTLREKHFELQSQLDRQARAEQVSATTYGANSKERAEDRAAREKLEKMAMGNQLAIAQLNYGMQKDNKVVANRNTAIDNAMKKAELIAKENGVSNKADFDAIYQPILQEELASLGLGGTMANPQQALPQGVKVTRLQ